MYSNLEITIKMALEYREHWFEGVVKCTLEDSFISVLEKIVKAEVRFLFCQSMISVSFQYQLYTNLIHFL